MNPWVAHVYAVITDATDTHILMIPSDAGWTLPFFLLHRKFASLHLLQRAVKERLNADMTVLRWIYEQINEDERVTRDLWLMENHTPDWTPPAESRWIDRDEIETLPLADEWMREHLAGALDSLVEPVPEKRPPWYRPGWYDQARDWTIDELNRLGYSITTPPEQFKQFSISSLLRAETTSGDIYFKIANALPLFGNEPKLLIALGGLFPQHIPVPIAIDEPRRWMLCTDFGQQVSGSNPTFETLEHIMTEYAHLQLGTASMLETLFDAGCLDRRLDVLAGQIDALIADEACYSELNADEKAAWQSCAPQLKAVCAKLADYKIPATLVHGDFHGGNIAMKDNQYLFFDWTDACIAHPFFDLPVFLEFTGRELDAALHETLRDTYLSHWTQYEPMERLREAYETAQIVAALHQAVSYQYIINAMEPRQRKDWDWGVPHFARMIVSRLS